MLAANNVQNEAQVSNFINSTEALNPQQIQVSQVVEEVEKCIKSLEEDCEIVPWENRIFYAELLAQIYYQTSHTPRLEDLAISQLSANIAILNDFLCISVVMNFREIKFMFLSEKLKQKFDNLKRPT